MITKVPISSIWQQINITGQYRNNINERIQIQSNTTIPDSEIAGIVVKAYEVFTIPNDGLQYWVRTMNKVGELIVDTIFTAGGAGSAGDTSTIDTGSGVTAGGGLSTTVTFLTAGSLEYQLVVTPTGTSTGDFGEITVENISATSAKIYNSGLAELPFDFIVLV